jgi:very-short-patch-repair endonuclease
VAGAVVMTLGQLGLVSVFLVWSRRTRPYIPFVTLALTVPLFFVRVAVEELAAAANTRFRAEREADAALRRRGWAADGASAFGAPSFGGGLAGPFAEWQQCPVERIGPEYGQYQREVSARRGVPPGFSPSAWPTARYMATAGAHPEVGRFLAQMRGFATEMRDGSPAWLAEHLAMNARSGGLSQAQIDEVLARCARLRFPAIQRYWTLQRAAADAGLEYHRYLVAVDGRVHYDAERDAAIFDRERELARARRLANRFDEKVAAIRAEASAQGFVWLAASPRPYAR